MNANEQCGKFKWVLLDAAGGIQHQGVAYGIARTYFPERADPEIYQLVRDSMLELWDDGLVVFFYSSFDGGFAAELDQVDRLTRAQLVRALTEGVGAQPEPDRFVFFIATDKGTQVFRDLPPGSLLNKPS